MENGMKMIDNAFMNNTSCFSVPSFSRFFTPTRPVKSCGFVSRPPQLHLSPLEALAGKSHVPGITRIIVEQKQ